MELASNTVMYRREEEGGGEERRGEERRGDGDKSVAAVIHTFCI